MSTFALPKARFQRLSQVASASMNRRCWLGVSDGALRDRGLSRRLAIVITFVALDAALVALAFEPPLDSMFIMRAAVVSLNGLAALVLVAQLTRLSPTDGEGARNRWATDPGRHKVGRVRDY